MQAMGKLDPRVQTVLDQKGQERAVEKQRSADSMDRNADLMFMEGTTASKEKKKSSRSPPLSFKDRTPLMT
jgi:hypothetical protein